MDVGDVGAVVACEFWQKFMAGLVLWCTTGQRDL